MTVTDLPAARAASIFFIRFRRSGHSTMLVATINPLFVLTAMGLGLGSLIEDRSALGGVDYLSFLAPGMLAAFAMQGAAAESLWPVLGGLKWEGTFVAQAATSLRPVDALLGRLVFVAFRIGIGSTMVFVAMLVLGAVESPWGVLAPFVGLVTGVCYAALITAFSSTQETDIAFPLVFRFGVIPSYLFSGTFFPVSQLPDALEAVAKITPLWHGVTLCRSLSLGNATLLGALGHLAYLGAFLALALLWGARSFERRLHQ